MSDIATGKDADFSEERLIERYNADLANNRRQSCSIERSIWRIDIETDNYKGRVRI